MSIRRMFIIVAVIVMMLAVSAGSTGYATAQNSASVTIPYSGQLTGDNREAVADGTYAMQFSIYTAPSAGELIWTETQSNVIITAGSFAVVLGSQTPIPDQASTSGKAWLEVSIRSPNETAFTILTPRQEINPDTTLQNNASSCAHNHFFENWSAPNTMYGLRIENTGTGDGIRGIAYANAFDYAGIVGVNYGAGPGIYGNGYGGGPGVVGYSTWRGVYGNGADGVVGESSTDTKSGVYGLNNAVGYGVTGRGESNFGVFAWGNDNTLYDTKGDILLQGYYGELFSNGDYLDLFTNGNVWIDLDNDKNTTYSFFQILAGDDSALWTVSEPSGNVVSKGSLASAVSTTDQGQRLMYSIQGTGVWLEDIGTTTLVNGAILVQFDPIYAQAASLNADYQVFVTATCDQPVLLYVSSKTSTGFTVKGANLDGSPSNCPFDYRVVASRTGYETVRTEQFIDTGKAQP